MAAPTVVRGHSCEGLTRFQSRIDFDNKSDPNHICIPILDEDGMVQGCDATNYAIIKFCPFCGISLQEKRS